MDVTVTFFVIGSYFLGAIPTGVVLARLRGKQDLRTAGSGNIGATNATRLLGKKIGAFTFLGDMLKGCLPVLAAALLLSDGRTPQQLQFAVGACGLAAFLGHLYPVYIGFKGGKGVATACGVFLGLEPLTIPALLIVFVAVAAISRYVSLGSLAAATAMPFLLLCIDRQVQPVPPATIALSVAMAVLIFLKHRANIQRLLHGTENRIGAKKADPIV